MPDDAFDDPRLAALYDPLDPDRSDLETYLAIVQELGARRVLDLGCGTGSFPVLLAEHGIDVVGVDPARASLDLARAKRPDLTWLETDATALPNLQVDVATMLGNVAQVFLTDDDWLATLRGIRRALRPGGHVVFETRVPERQAWLEWDREHTWSRSPVAGVGVVETWCEVTDVTDTLVTFRWTYAFEQDGSVLTSESTLRFRHREEVELSLEVAGFEPPEVRDAPDRPGREHVYLARRAA